MARNQVKTNSENNYQGAPMPEHGAPKMERETQWRVPKLNRAARAKSIVYAIERFKQLRYQLTTIGAEKAWRVANELLDDINTPARTRWDIAKTFLLMAGHVPPRPTAPDAVNDKPLVERSTADLRALVDQLEGELAGRAVPISAPAERPLASQAVDMWG